MAQSTDVSNLKCFIIYLPKYQKSVEWSNISLQSGLELGWNVTLFEGVDGLTVQDNTNWGSWGIKINRKDSKCLSQFERPGVRGCFLSHWLLWKKCLELNEPIGIFEHDVLFKKSMKEIPIFNDILKLEGYILNKAKPAGPWYEGARAYLITPLGAKKLVDWVEENGCLPADVVIGKNVVDIQLDKSEYVITFNKSGIKNQKNSFTWNLSGMK